MATSVEAAAGKGWRRIYFNAAAIPFWAIHLAAVVGLAIVGFSWAGLALCAAFYAVRMFFVTGAYHRYFAHRSYKTSRAFQFVLALGATLTAQKGPLWWAAHHRNHHRFSDTERDVHSPKRGFWWSHVLWMLTPAYEATQWDRIKDFAKFPELRFLNKHWWLPPTALAVSLFLIGGWSMLLISFFLSTALLWHGTFTINSLSHVFGKRRYATSDTSRNNWLLALITCGEGWHNNHHHFCASANQGFFWWEVDISYYVIKLMEALGLAWDVRTPSESALNRNRIDADSSVLAMPSPADAE
jgi:stearoyl-CoA desaturase (Delta-9 desaturase)